MSVFSRSILSMKVAVFFATLLTITATTFRAEAAWGDLFCDITNGSADALQSAIDLYSNPDEVDRECKYAIRFKAAQRIQIPGFVIDRTPPSGSTYGFSIRRCVSSGQYAEPGCPVLSNTDVVIDVSGYTADGGDCPIKVFSGAKIDIQYLRIIAPNPSKAICTSAGVAIPLEDKVNPYAWIHNVDIVRSGTNPTAPTCNLTSTPTVTGGDDLSWTTTGATTATLNDGTTTLSSALNSASPLHVAPSSTTTYKLSADGPGGHCEDTVVVTVAPVTPTCNLTSTPATTGDDLSWTTTGATTATLSNGTTTLSSALNSASPLNVTPSVTTVYTLSADGPGGHCEDTVVVTVTPATPTCDLTSTPGAGGSFDLNWTSTNATTASLSDGSTTLSTALSGTTSVIPSVSTTYTLNVSGAGGSCSKSVTLTPSLPGAPTCNLTATPGAAGSFDLTWSTVGAATASLSDGSSTLSTALLGATNVTPSSSTTYTLSATGSGGSCSRSIILSPGGLLPPTPTCNLNAAPGVGSSFDITWLVTNGTTVALSDGIITLSTALAGTTNVTPVSPKTYTLTASGAGGSCSTAITLTPGSVPAPSPTCNLSAASTGGGNFDVTWLTTNATTVALSDGGSTLSSAISGTVSVTPASPTVYTLTATGSGGSCSTAVTLPPMLPPAPTCNLSSAPGVSGSFDLTWSTTNATTASLSDGSSTISSLLSGTSNVTPSVSTTYTLTATGSGGGCSKEITINPSAVVPVTPVCNFSAAPGAGSSFDLTWSTTGATTVALGDGGSTLSSAVSGTLNVTPVVPTTYTLTATASGGTCSRSIILTPGSPVPASPTCSLSAAAGVGNSFDITWSTTGATTVDLSDGATTLSTAVSGTQSVPVTSPKTVTLTGTSAGGACSDAVNLTPPLPPAPTCTFTSAPAAGGSFSLTWSTTGAATAGLSDGTTTLSTALSGLQSVTPSVTTTYTLSATGAGGSCSKAIVLGPTGTGGCVDTDGDGLCDATELIIGTDPTNPDTDGDGTIDPLDCAPLDPARATGASCAGVLNSDWDGDGIPNASDNCPAAPNADQKDSNHNGIGDVCDPNSSVSTNDSDGDGIPDAQEANYGTDPNNPDTDGDGLPDGQEVLSPFYPVCGPTDPDCDNDGVCDGPGTVKDAAGNIICQPFDGHGDNCILVSNGPNTPSITPEEIQADSNGNGIGDACEGDFDGDGVPDQIDNCPFNPNPDQTDNNNNGIGDVCDMSLAIFQGGGGSGGCGCRMDGNATSSPQDLLGLLTMGLPLVLFRAMRKKKSAY